MKSKQKIPARVQLLLNLYYVDNPKKRISDDIIVHKILANGDSPELKWLFKNFSKQKIKDIFIKNPSKEYNSLAYNSVKNFLLNLDKVSLQRDKYVAFEYRRPETHL